MFLAFDAGMSASEGAGATMIDWYVEPDHSGADTRTRGFSRVRRDEERANSLALIVTTSLLFILFASALMVGGHAAIGPLLFKRTAASDANSRGDIVYAMPDGVFCRHMSFDNATGEIHDGAVERCGERPDRADSVTSTKFKWGAH
jgi:hypothetical protein